MKAWAIRSFSEMSNRPGGRWVYSLTLVAALLTPLRWWASGRAHAGRRYVDGASALSGVRMFRKRSRMGCSGDSTYALARQACAAEQERVTSEHLPSMASFERQCRFLRLAAIQPESPTGPDDEIHPGAPVGDSGSVSVVVDALKFREVVGVGVDRDGWRGALLHATRVCKAVIKA